MAKNPKAEVDKVQLDFIISTIETVCKMLLALIPILKGILGSRKA